MLYHPDKGQANLDTLTKDTDKEVQLLHNLRCSYMDNCLYAQNQDELKYHPINFKHAESNKIK